MKKVIFHIDSNSSWEKLLGNLKNILIELKHNKDRYKVEVLANSSAVKGYLDNNIIDSVINFGSDVTFVACNNALNNNKIKKDDLNPLITVTAAGVYYLTVMQKEGFAYIKV